MNKMEKHRMWSIDSINKKIKEYGIRIPTSTSLTATKSRIEKRKHQVEEEIEKDRKSLEDNEYKLKAISEIEEMIRRMTEISKR
jgi:hypothetical protein